MPEPRARRRRPVRRRAAASLVFAVLPVAVYLVAILIDLLIVNSGFYEQTSGVSVVAVWWVSAVPVIARVAAALSLLLSAILGILALRGSRRAPSPESAAAEDTAVGRAERESAAAERAVPGRGLAIVALSSAALVTVVWLAVSGALDWLLWP